MSDALAVQLAKRTGYNLTEAKAMIDMVADAMRAELLQRGSVRLRPIGTLRVSRDRARIGIDITPTNRMADALLEQRRTSDGK